jgi:DNA-binding response OmpR family regulator
MSRLSVLVIEDDAAIGLLLAEILEDMGHTVCAIEATETGAFRAALRCQPDLMIVDIRLRQGSGILAVKEIRSFRSVPHVFVSGDRFSVRGVEPGAVIIQKPFREADLARAIERALVAKGKL